MFQGLKRVVTYCLNYRELNTAKRLQRRMNAENARYSKQYPTFQKMVHIQPMVVGQKVILRVSDGKVSALGSKRFGKKEDMDIAYETALTKAFNHPSMKLALGIQDKK